MLKIEWVIGLNELFRRTDDNTVQIDYAQWQQASGTSKAHIMGYLKEVASQVVVKDAPGNGNYHVEVLPPSKRKLTPGKLAKNRRFRYLVENFATLPDDTLVDVRVLMQVLSRSLPSIYRDIREGRVPKPMRVGKRAIRWQAGDLRKHLAERAKSVKPQ